jgi:hypothetical protein
MDAIEILLTGKSDPHAKLLLAFHRRNPTFIPRVAAELRLLRNSGQKAAAVRSIIHYLRWETHWNGVDQFEVNQNLAALVGRVCILLWPDLDGLVQLRKSRADTILGTRRGRSGKRYTNLLIPPPWFTVQGAIPAVPQVDRPRTNHFRITKAEAAEVIAAIEKLVRQAPDPDAELLQDFLRHVRQFPELFYFMQRTLLARSPSVFSGVSLIEYTRWSIRRAAAQPKRFRLSSRFDGLYCRFLVLLNPEFNGRCEFKRDGLHGVSNKLLGVGIAEHRVEGERYRRLVSQ